MKFYLDLKIQKPAKLEELQTELAKIPKDVSTLILRTSYSFAPDDSLVYIFKNIPEWITHLEYINDECRTEQMLPEKLLANAMMAMTARIQELTFTGHSFCSKERLTTMINAIPKTVVNLHLIECLLPKATYSKMSIFELADALGRLQNNVSYVDLRRNNLSDFPGTELSILLSKFSKEIKVLDLRENNLEDEKTTAQLIRMIKSTPDSIELMAYNEKGFMPKTELLAELSPDYSFYFNCVTGIAASLGGLMFIIGLIALQPVIAAIGGSVLLGSILCFGVFSLKTKDAEPQPDLEHQPGQNLN